MVRGLAGLHIRHLWCIQARSKSTKMGKLRYDLIRFFNHLGSETGETTTVSARKGQMDQVTDWNSAGPIAINVSFTVSFTTPLTRPNQRVALVTEVEIGSSFSGSAQECKWTCFVMKCADFPKHFRAFGVPCSQVLITVVEWRTELQSFQWRVDSDYCFLLVKYLILVLIRPIRVKFYTRHMGWKVCPSLVW